MIVDIEAVNRVAVPTRAGMYPNILTFFGGEAVEDPIYRLVNSRANIIVGLNDTRLGRQHNLYIPVVQFNERIEELGSSPGIPRVVLCCKTAFCEVDATGIKILDLWTRDPGGGRFRTKLPHSLSASSKNPSYVLLTLLIILTSVMTLTEKSKFIYPSSLTSLIRSSTNFSFG